ncbi:hypothetical protein [Metabacillus fastidiosus]|uniref:TMhelix containing protein n=1 Tax=Metabacillus fastidiosus TaxID=1458 RepID=A0ABU6P473_9BACI|nr:hypothetical protein [Metabacillus fastidiosus]MED4404086.1 hypothetical protein [Metabacillus fastidiosus]
MKNNMGIYDQEKVMDKVMENDIIRFPKRINEQIHGDFVRKNMHAEIQRHGHARNIQAKAKQRAEEDRAWNIFAACVVGILFLTVIFIGGWIDSM